MANKGHSVHFRHAQITQDDIKGMTPAQIERLATIGGNCQRGDALFQVMRQFEAGIRIVFDKKKAERI